MAGGRPRIVSDPEEFARLVEEYRIEREQLDRPMTFTGLALHLGFSSRRTFYEYSHRPEFSHPVKRAQALIEAQYEESLSGNNVAGAIFALKNHGWSDRHEFTGDADNPIGIAITRRVVDGDS